MKDFLKVMVNDYKEMGLTAENWVAAIVVAVVMIAVMGFAGWLESL